MSHLFVFHLFSSVSRYEHSLGVCHLAGLLSEQLGLSEKDKIELMLAGLYHDVATPPYAHLMEEVLKNLYGFDHEEQLRNIIIGQHDKVGGKHVQIFQGRMLKLHRVCQSKHGRKLGLDSVRIANLAAGAEFDILGDLICSKDIDIDNIDNVVRSASAMGIHNFSTDIAEIITKSFIINNKKLYLDSGIQQYLVTWQKVRETLYSMIFSSITDFSLQTMVKDAIQLIAEAEPKYRLAKEDWALTETDFLNKRLLKYKKTSEIFDQIKLGKVYNCLAYFRINGGDILNPLNENLSTLQNIAEKHYKNYIQTKFNRKQGDSQSTRVLLNFYFDKRKRTINRPMIFFNNIDNKSIAVNEKPKLLVGIFTPYHLKWDNSTMYDFFYEIKSLKVVEDLRIIKIFKDKYPFVKGVPI